MEKVFLNNNFRWNNFSINTNTWNQFHCFIKYCSINNNPSYCKILYRSL